MKNVLNFAVKTALIGLAIAVVGALLGGVGFPAILFRVLISAVIAGALGAGGYFVVEKFLPELLALAKSDTTEGDLLDGGISVETTGDTGQRVNIVVDDDSPEGDQAEQLRAEASGMPDRDGRSETVGVNENPGNLFTSDDSDLVQEVKESGSESSGSGDEETFYGGVEGLPDISGFSDSFADQNFADDEEAPPGENPAESSDYSLSGSLDSPGSAAADSGIDPKLMAQAIKTALKKG